MTDTTFVDYTTPVPAAWLNDINDHVYNNTPISPATTVHPASVIANTPAGTIAATTVQAAINELDTEKLAISAIGTSVPSPTGTGASGTWGISITGNAATASDAAAHIADTIAAHAASAISNTPAGNIAATDVQAAINELDTEKAALTGATFTGVTAYPDGSASAPSIAHSGDLNCGIFFPAADTVAVATAGTELLRYTASGISTASSAAVVGGKILNWYNSDTGAGSYSQVNLQTNAGYLVSQIGSTANGGLASLYASASGGLVIYTSVATSLGLGTNSNSNHLVIDSTGNVTKNTATGLLGYGAGAGGTVTQTTSKSTAVTLNKPTGTVTMNNAALAAGATVQFAINCSLVAVGDTATACRGNGGTNNSYDIWTETVAAGVIYVNVKNISAGSLSEAVPVVFNLLKGASA